MKVIFGAKSAAKTVCTAFTPPPRIVEKKKTKYMQWFSTRNLQIIFQWRSKIPSSSKTQDSLKKVDAKIFFKKTPKKMTPMPPNIHLFFQAKTHSWARRRFRKLFQNILGPIKLVLAKVSVWKNQKTQKIVQFLHIHASPRTRPMPPVAELL